MANNLIEYPRNLLIDNIDTPEIDLEPETESDVEINTTSEQRKLYVDKVDKSTSDLFRMIVEGELNLQPEYQRKFIWDVKTMSKFIESLLLSIPIPTIFLAENDNDTLEVIDGQQRLTTIFSFMRANAFEKDMVNLSSDLKETKTLTLSGLETLPQYNQKDYSMMDSDKQRKFKNISLPIVIIKKDSTEDIKFDIFSRINSGSIKLNSQELLNVMYRGILLKNLDEIATSSQIDNLFGNRPVLKKRFGYHEILLRAIAMECFIDDETWQLKEVHIKHTNILKKKIKKYNGRLNAVILDYLKEFRNDVAEGARLKQFIKDTAQKISIVFGPEAFIRINKAGSTSINKTIAELQLVVLSKFDIAMIEKNKDKIKQSFDTFLSNSAEDIFIRGTNNTHNVEKRYEWGKAVAAILEEA